VLEKGEGGGEATGIGGGRSGGFDDYNLVFDEEVGGEGQGKLGWRS
jgi:hypothetical protein